MAFLLLCSQTEIENNDTMDFIPNQQTAAPRRGRGRGIMRTILIIAVLIFGIYFYWKYFMNYSSGNRYGLLQKFSHKGNLFKTYEGELILSSVRSNANVALASEKFFFSVNDRRTAEKLMNLQGRNVTLHYKEKNGTLPWRGDSPYIVDSVVVDTTDLRR
jgi:predicted secreted protein